MPRIRVAKMVGIAMPLAFGVVVFAALMALVALHGVVGLNAGSVLALVMLCGIPAGMFLATLVLYGFVARWAGQRGGLFVIDP